jgi:hypothetical protein
MEADESETILSQPKTFPCRQAEPLGGGERAACAGVVRPVAGVPIFYGGIGESTKLVLHRSIEAQSGVSKGEVPKDRVFVGIEYQLPAIEL